MLAPIKTQISRPNPSLFMSKFKTLNTKPYKPPKMTVTKKQYWLLKTEPSEWSWEHQKTNGNKSKWDGVKNKQAQNNLKSMKLNDLCFFYHSGTKQRRVVGVVVVVKEWYEDGDGVAVDVEAVGEMRRPVELGQMKVDERIKMSGFGVLRQPRLSVVGVSEEVWGWVCELGGGYVGDGLGGDEDETESEN